MNRAGVTDTGTGTGTATARTSVTGAIDRGTAMDWDGATARATSRATAMDRASARAMNRASARATPAAAGLRLAIGRGVGMRSNTEPVETSNEGLVRVGFTI